MKTTLFFKLIIDIVFFLLVPVVIFFPGTILYMVLFSEQTIINISIPFATAEGLTGLSLLFCFLFFVEILLFTAGFYHLRQLAHLTFKTKFLTQKMVST